MANIDHALKEFREMDDLAMQNSPVHALHPLSKLVITIAYIFTVVSFPKYNLSGLVPMVLYPIVMFIASGVSVSTCFYKLRLVLPLVLAVGLFNPIFDHTPLLKLGGVVVSGGVISMITLMLKGTFSLMASFILVATTSIDKICAALRKVHCPSMIVTLFLLTYRYIAVMIDEVAIMTTAYKLRAPGQKGIHYTAWGSFLGQLLLRSMDKADELFKSMQLRGFKGDFFYADVNKARAKDYAFFLLALALILIFRYFNVSAILGNILM